MKNIILFIAMLFICSCTDNQRAKAYGGSSAIDLPKNEKLQMITWKDADLWYITRPMRDGEVAESYKLQEKSNFGILEGIIIIREHK
jgi:hypothetical protein